MQHRGGHQSQGEECKRRHENLVSLCNKCHERVYEDLYHKEKVLTGMVAIVAGAGMGVISNSTSPLLAVVAQTLPLVLGVPVTPAQLLILGSGALFGSVGTYLADRWYNTSVYYCKVCQKRRNISQTYYGCQSCSGTMEADACVQHSFQ